MDDTALIANWVLWAVLAVNFGLTLTALRRRPWAAKPGMRWLWAGLLIMASAQLANLYVYRLHLHALWAPLLFVLTVPCLAMAVTASITALARSARRQPPGTADPAQS